MTEQEKKEFLRLRDAVAVHLFKHWADNIPSTNVVSAKEAFDAADIFIKERMKRNEL